MRLVFAVVVAGTLGTSCVRPPAAHDAGAHHVGAQDAGAPQAAATRAASAVDACADATLKLDALLTSVSRACASERDCVAAPTKGRSCNPLVVSKSGWADFDKRHGDELRATRAVVDAVCPPSKPCEPIPFVPECIEGRCQNGP